MLDTELEEMERKDRDKTTDTEICKEREREGGRQIEMKIEIKSGN